MSSNDLYSTADNLNHILPVSVSGTVTTNGVAVNTQNYDGIINFIVNSSTLTGAMTVSGTLQASGTSGWADISGRTFSLLNSSSTAFVTSTYGDSRDGSLLRASILTTSGPIVLSSVAVSPKKIV